MNKTNLIILVSTSNHDARAICEAIEGNEYSVNDAKCGEMIHSAIRNQFPTLKYDDVQVYSLHDFALLNNNEDYYADDWFMSYVIAC